jgi:pantetheine-phosphate adenylyltransferase
MPKSKKSKASKKKTHAALVGLYPGTFDPITLGHSDIIQRAARVVGKLVIGVAENAGKGPLFSVAERVALVKEEIRGLDTNGVEIEVRPFKNLLIEFAGQVKAGVIIRGLRAVSDFEYEFQMAGMNHKLAPRLETVFLMASDQHHFISSHFVKEIARLGGNVSPFVSKAVLKKIRKKLG